MLVPPLCLRFQPLQSPSIYFFHTCLFSVRLSSAHPFHAHLPPIRSPSIQLAGALRVEQPLPHDVGRHDSAIGLLGRCTAGARTS